MRRPSSDNGFVREHAVNEQTLTALTKVSTEHTSLPVPLIILSDDFAISAPHNVNEQVVSHHDIHLATDFVLEQE